MVLASSLARAARRLAGPRLLPRARLSSGVGACAAQDTALATSTGLARRRLKLGAGVVATAAVAAAVADESLRRCILCVCVCRGVGSQGGAHSMQIYTLGTRTGTRSGRSLGDGLDMQGLYSIHDAAPLTLVHATTPYPHSRMHRHIYAPTACTPMHAV